MCFAGDLANFRALYKADVHSAGIVDIGTSEDGTDQDSAGLALFRIFFKPRRHTSKGLLKINEQRPKVSTRL